jgi:hypothetical protein
VLTSVPPGRPIAGMRVWLSGPRIGLIRPAISFLPSELGRLGFPVAAQVVLGAILGVPLGLVIVFPQLRLSLEALAVYWLLR